MEEIMIYKGYQQRSFWEAHDSDIILFEIKTTKKDTLMHCTIKPLCNLVFQ